METFSSYFVKSSGIFCFIPTGAMLHIKLTWYKRDINSNGYKVDQVADNSDWSHLGLEGV